MKTILIFLNGELLRSMNYNSKREAWKQYKLFKTRGILSGETGLCITGASFEII